MIRQIGGQIRHDAGGEGSKGGHVIGHTSSGKAIYSSHTAAQLRNMRPERAWVSRAYDIHQAMAAEHGKDHPATKEAEKQWERAQSTYNQSQAKKR